MENLVYYLPAFGLVGLLYMAYLFNWVTAQDAGDSRMKQIAGYIRDGAMAFLKAEYRVLAIYVVIAGICLGLLSFQVHTTHWIIVIAFILGALFSVIAGYIGMRIATLANVRTTQAAKTSIVKALHVSFRGGTVMGLGVAGLAILGMGGLFIALTAMFVAPGDAVTGSSMRTAIEVLAGFSLGVTTTSIKFISADFNFMIKGFDTSTELRSICVFSYETI